MPENSWPESHSYPEPEPLGSLVAEVAPESIIDDEPESIYQRGYPGRRRKAAVALGIIWSGTIALHLSTWGSWLIFGLTTLMGIHAIRVLFARPLATPQPLAEDRQAEWPLVSLMVAAKNEEAVIGRLVKLLCNLDYPVDRYEVWIIDDNSSDRTPHLLKQLAHQYSQLRVFHRPANSGGGKSGALNQVLPMTKGDIVVVFDADAQVAPDLLRRVLPLFQEENVGAVQVQKAIANATTNFWTRGQVAEMALDSYFQQQRIAIGGIGELRGNGQFVRRQALEQCGGWNEETITDDLDLTIRLHLERWDVAFLLDPCVQEEGVTKAISLWHQRNRWAEGGYQRYLDYWRPILQNRMGTRKTIDLFMFFLTQYILPTAAVPDFLMALLRSRSLALTPTTSLMLSLSFFGMFLGLRRIQQLKPRATTRPLSTIKGWDFSVLVAMLQTVRGLVYMLHWILIMSTTTARMAVRPKQLKWVKTVHQGMEHESEPWVEVSSHPSDS